LAYLLIKDVFIFQLYWDMLEKDIVRTRVVAEVVNVPALHFYYLSHNSSCGGGGEIVYS
jgi:hypothetical protein